MPLSVGLSSCLIAGSKVAVAPLRIADILPVFVVNRWILSHTDEVNPVIGVQCAFASGTFAAKCCDAPVVFKLRLL